MEDARLEASGGKGALDDAVIATGAFDGDEAIAELLSSKSVLKWNTTGLMKVRVAMLRSGVRKLAPIEAATNNSATSAAEAVPSSR